VTWGRGARPAASLALAAATLALIAAAGCSYGPPTWRHQVMNAMPQPLQRHFAVVVLSTLAREPRGLSAWPDGGRERVEAQMARLWFCDPEAGTARLMSRISRPKPIRSEYSAWIVAWDSTGEYPSLYLDVRGRAGETSDTNLLRYLLKVEIDPDTSRAVAVPFIPSGAAPLPPIGPLHGGPELQVSAGDTIRVRTDLDPEWRPRFAIDPKTGDVSALAPGRE
jgi:hypothetical protein